MKALGITCIFAGLAIGCTPADDEGEELIDGTSLDGLYDEGKADTAGGRYVKVVGSIPFGDSRTVAITNKTRYLGYRVTAGAGDQLVARGIGNGGLGLISLYGPKRPDGTWGTLVQKKWYTYQKDAILTHTAAKSGKYLIVIGLPGGQDAEGTGFVTLCDRDGTCPQMCVEHGHSTDTTKSGNFYADNVSSEDEGNFRAAYGSPIHIVIRDGSCGEQPETCSTTKKQVCGHIKNTTRTYYNLCELQVAVRNAAVDEWANAAGYWTLGACP